MVYRLEKNPGVTAPLILINKDTNSNIFLGKMTVDMLSILREDEGIEFNKDDSIRLIDGWKFDIQGATAAKLAKKTFSIKRPDRTKPQAEIQTEKPKKNNKKVDAIDVLLGLANYK